MLTFLNSIVLFGLAAAAIPFLIHLFTRQKTKVLLFSSLQFLRELQQQKIRRLKIRQILLLILRTLLVLALVFAFARPTLRSSGSAGAHTDAPVTAVIILDNTLSMGLRSGGRRLLDEAKERATTILSTLKQGDAMHLLYPHGAPVPAVTEPRFSPETMNELVAATDLAFSTTDYLSALSASNQILDKSSNLNKEIYLIGDLRANGFNVGKRGEQPHALLGDDVKLYVVPVTGDGPNNLTITTVRLTNQILEEGKVAEVSAQVRNDSEARVSGKLAHLFVNGKRVAQQVFDVEAKAFATILFRMVPDRTGFQSGYVLLEDDDLNEDNRRHFGFNIADEIRVLLVGHSADDVFHLNLALHPGDDVASYLKTTSITADAFEAHQVAGYDVIILSNLPRLSNQSALKIQNFLRNGGGLLVFPGADADLRNYNETLHKKLKLPALTQTVRRNSKQFLSLGRFDFNHPIFKGVFDGDEKVGSPHVQFALNVEPGTSYQKVIEYSNGSPFLFESQYGSGNVLYVTTGVSSDWSDLAFRGLFVPLVNRSIFYLAGAASTESQQIIVGQEATFASDRIDTRTDLEIEKPDGSRALMRRQASKGQTLTQFTDTGRPGTYRLLRGDEVQEQWAVNYSATELEGDYWDVATLQAELGQDRSIYELGKDDDLTQELQESRFGREFWKVLLFVALALLVLEALLAREKAIVDASG